MSCIDSLVTPIALGFSDDIYIQTTAVAIVGGTTSELTGGKFANGAVTAAMSFAASTFRASDSKNILNQDEEVELPPGVVHGEVDPDGPLSYPGVRKAFRDAWFSTFADTEYYREQGGWNIKPKGVRKLFRDIVGKPAIFSRRVPSGGKRSINLGPRPLHAHSAYHTHPTQHGPPWASERDLNFDGILYIIGRGGVTRLNTDNTQEYLGTLEEVLHP